MDASRLAVRNKREKDWGKLLLLGFPDKEVEGMFRSALGWYRETLARLWESGNNEKDEALLNDLERRLDELYEEGRFLSMSKPSQGGARV